MFSVPMKVEISKEKYDLVMADNRLLVKLAEECAIESGYHPNGYCLIDPKVIEEDNKYYVTWERFSSCD